MTYPALVGIQPTVTEIETYITTANLVSKCVCGDTDTGSVVCKALTQLVTTDPITKTRNVFPNKSFAVSWLEYNDSNNTFKLRQAYFDSGSNPASFEACVIDRPILENYTSAVELVWVPSETPNVYTVTYTTESDYSTWANKYLPTIITVS
jgi:hypothetical protein